MRCIAASFWTEPKACASTCATPAESRCIRAAPSGHRRASGAALAAALAAGLAAGAAPAEVPRVAVDIAPVHSLVAQVMGDLGEPDLVLPPGASPHGYALRPSEARALQSADLVVWVGPALTPWLASPLESLAGDARTVEAMEAEGVALLEVRESAVFPAHEAEGDHDHDHDHAHDDHAGEDAHAGHDHGAYDPHVWLDPENAAAIVRAVAASLAELDPDNADAYAANAERAVAGLGALEADVSATLAPARGMPFVVFHDGYQYFEHAFGLEAAGAISMSDARMPSAARLAELRERLAGLGAACVAAEPQFDPGLVQAVAEGAQARTAVLDPIGVDLSPGRGLYGAMMRGLAEALAGCAVQG